MPNYIQFPKFLFSLYNNLQRRTKHFVLILLDLITFLVTIYIAFTFRLERFDVLPIIMNFMNSLWLLIPMKLLVFHIMGLYRPVIRYIGFEFIFTAFKSIFFSSGFVIIISYFFKFSPEPPRSVLIIDGAATFISVVFIRHLLRWLAYQLYLPTESKYPSERIIIYGAGSAGNQLLSSVEHDSAIKVVAFIDSSPELNGQIFRGVRVYNPNKMAWLIKKFKVDSILLAIPSAGRQQKTKIFNELQEFQLPVKTIPSVGELLSGNVSINEIRQIDIKDILGREFVAPDMNLLRKNIVQKVVLITGAGGSIGSQICRQIANLSPKQIILLDQSEHALYSIDLELHQKFPKIARVSRLASVCDEIRVKEILVQYKVDTIYHAAAYKHVPIVEDNPREGILNNVLGTYRVAKAALDAKVETFVLISTDKAVRPTNVMGASKRVAELVLQGLASKKPDTKFVMVRFGNVIDSAGSVVPLFRKQLQEGQPLTITHKDITRYFMTIPEAARLVIQAGALGKGGEVFLLDMGEPVRIYDLAIQMIKLSGLEVDKDISIKFTGLRPGEKLYEELLIDSQKAEKTSHPKIFSAKESFIPWDDLKKSLELIAEYAENNDKEKLIQIITTLVPEHSHYEDFNSKVDLNP